MANMTPEQYNMIKNEIKGYEKQVIAFSDESNKKLFVHIDNIKSNIDKGNQLIGKIDMAINCLKDESDKRGKWEYYKETVNNIVDNLRNKYPDMF